MSRMSRTMLSSIVLTGLLAAGGCKSNNASTVAEVPAPSAGGPIVAAHDPALAGPQPVALKGSTPAPYAEPDAFTLGTPAPAAPAPGALGGGSYVVRERDTLWSIAATRYGNGQRWRDIAAANPGLTPEKLRVGMAIVLP